MVEAAALFVPGMAASGGVRMTARAHECRRIGGGQDPEYLAWLRQQSCCARNTKQCRGRIEAHHAGRHGMSIKCPDREAIPLCGRHHREWHAANGRFAGMGKAARRLWSDAAILETQQAYEFDVQFQAQEFPF